MISLIFYITLAGQTVPDQHTAMFDRMSDCQAYTQQILKQKNVLVGECKDSDNPTQHPPVDKTLRDLIQHQLDDQNPDEHPILIDRGPIHG